MSDHGPKPEPKTDHLTVLPAGIVAPEFHFQLERKRTGNAILASVATHVGLALLVQLVARLIPKETYKAILPDKLSDQIVWLSEPGPGGGGGGGGNKMPEPPKPAELPGKQKITVPVTPKPAEEPPKPEPEKPEELNIPAQ